MAQTVDLGYVVGPTGPKGDDATLPETAKVDVYVTCDQLGSDIAGTEYYLLVDYFQNRQLVTTRVDPGSNTNLSVDKGSLVVVTSMDPDTDSVCVDPTYALEARTALGTKEVTITSGLYGNEAAYKNGCPTNFWVAGTQMTIASRYLPI